MEDAEDGQEYVGQSQDPTFLRRLAGPSAHKVGYGIDQAEINRRIADASKGSKFYENEKRRDKDWTERINKILKHRDKLLRESDIPRVEAKVDRIFAEKESRRDLTQTIVHIDMDAFFANVELQHNPDLKDKPFAVVGLGVVTTGSYEARRFGVRAGQPEYIAKRLCPELILVPVDYKRVAIVSTKVMNVCKRYDPNLHIAGCDEAYLNVTGYMHEHGMNAEDCVLEIRSKIFEETNMTASAGIAPNMMLAKICSDRNKPNGQYQMLFTREAVMEFVRDLPVRKVPGIGRVGERVLEALGVKTCGDIRDVRAIIWLMPRKFAVDFLFDTHLGLSLSILKPYQREERKSVGVSRTFRPVSTKEAIFEKLEYIASLLERDLEIEGWAGKIVILTYKLDTFQVHTRRATFERWISKKEDLLSIGKDLIKPYLPLRVRLLGLRVTDLIDLRAPRDQGIKRFFEQEGYDTSPAKKRKLTPEPNRFKGSPSPTKRRNAREEGSIIKPIIVDEQEEEEEELVGKTEENEDELDDEDGDSGVESPHSDEGQAARAPEDQDVPTFQYRYGATSVIKIGNDRKTVGAKSKKPNSSSETGRQRSSGSLLSASVSRKRGKSEQPRAKSEMVSSMSDSSASIDLCPPSRTEVDIGQTASPSSNTRGRYDTIVCPICSRKLEMDNSEVNAHIDYCLSRGTIRAASSAAVSTMAVPPKERTKRRTGEIKREPGG